MDNFTVFGRLLVGLGIAIALVGGIVWLLGRFGGLSRLPGRRLRFVRTARANNRKQKQRIKDLHDGSR